MAVSGSCFSSADTPHGLAKRKLVKGYCGGLFARELESAKFGDITSRVGFRVAYIDAFCWRGEYGGPETRSQHLLEEEEEEEEDIAAMGSPIIALDRGLDRIKLMAERGVIRVIQMLFAIHFVFNDLDAANVSNVRKLVDKWMTEYKWERQKNNLDEFFDENPNSKSYLWRFIPARQAGSTWLIRTTFVTGKFENLQIPPALKTFSFIDPCGIAQIPFDSVKRFLGPGKEVFINLMVMTIRRSSANPRHEMVIKKLFGNPESNSIIKSFAKCPKETCQMKTKVEQCCLKRAYSKYVEYYSKSIEDECSQQARAVHFLFSKGKQSKDVGDQFYMVYLSSDMDLKMVKMMKDAMMSIVQTPDGELRHTDFYSFKGINIPFGRKTTNEEEKKAIYKHFEGQTVSLYDLKYWILVNSPFTFHSRVLGLLEKERLLTVETKGQSRMRKKGNFMATEFYEFWPSASWQLEFHHSPVEQVVFCAYCPHKTKTAGGMKQHVNKKHVREENNNFLE